MKNTIEEISDRKFTVNGKEVYLDMNENWHSKYLTISEQQAAIQHIAKLTNKTA